MDVNISLLSLTRGSIFRQFTRQSDMVDHHHPTEHDWINKNKPEVVFKYSTHGMDEYAHIYFEPMKNLITIEADMEYYNFEVKFTIKIDDEKKKVRNRSIFL